MPHGRHASIEAGVAVLVGICFDQVSTAKFAQCESRLQDIPPVLKDVIPYIEQGYVTNYLLPGSPTYEPEDVQALLGTFHGLLYGSHLELSPITMPSQAAGPPVCRNSCRYMGKQLQVRLLEKS